MKLLRDYAVAAFGLTLILCHGSSFADDQEPAVDARGVQQQESAKSDRPLLAGPKVEEGAKVEAAVTRMGEQQQRAEGPHVPPMMWLRFVRPLDLAEGQEKRIREFVDAHGAAMREFREEHGEALQMLQREMREAREAENPERVRKLMGTMHEIRAEAPDHQRLQRAIWDTLTAEQQQMLREGIAAWQKERQERMRQRRNESGEPGAGWARRPALRDQARRSSERVRQRQRP